jgi:hypothetical protein
MSATAKLVGSQSAASAAAEPASATRKRSITRPRVVTA